MESSSDLQGPSDGPAGTPRARGRAAASILATLPTVGGSTRLLEENADEADPTVEVLASVDEPDIENALVHIRAIVKRTFARGAEEIGTYLLTAFYGGDPVAYASKSPKAHLSLGRLVAHCGTQRLPVSRTFISNAIRMVAITRALPAESCFGQLPFSHRVELLKLPDPARIEDVSTRVLAGGATVRQVREHVKTIQVPATRKRAESTQALSVMRRVITALSTVAAPTERDQGAGVSFQLTLAQRGELVAELEQATELMAAMRRRVSAP